MNYFLVKTEPQDYSIDDLKREKRTWWNGVRNPQALRALREMRPGDRVLIYHSGGESAIVGTADVASEPSPDPADAKLTIVQFQYRSHLEPRVPLAEIKASGLFPALPLVRQPRLSTMRIPDEFIAWLRERAPGAGA